MKTSSYYRRRSYAFVCINSARNSTASRSSRRYFVRNKFIDRMIKQLLNSVQKYRDLSVSRKSIICLSLRLRQIIDLLATDKSRYFAQPRPITVNCRRVLKTTEYVERLAKIPEDCRRFPKTTKDFRQEIL